jgi:hypothetical protein
MELAGHSVICGLHWTQINNGSSPTTAQPRLEQKSTRRNFYLG